MTYMTKERKLLPIVLDGYKPLRDVVFETLRDAIITQVLKPGERLMEIQLADEMGVSRTPVREAIRKLELEGLVIMVPRKGAYVAGVSMKDIHEVYEVRAALEMLAVSLAAERITDEELDALERQVLRESECNDSWRGAQLFAYHHKYVDHDIERCLAYCRLYHSRQKDTCKNRILQLALFGAYVCV